MNLNRKDFQLKFKTGTDSDKSKFKKECVQGEFYYTTDTNRLYVAETTAGASDATLSVFYDIFNVTTRDTEANILSSTPTNPSGEVNIAFGTDTYEFYIFTPEGSWLIFNNDS
jgi:hypothetical protein